MKRSTTLKLAALGGLPLVLAYCQTRTEPTRVVSRTDLYTSIDQCYASRYDVQACSDSWRVAREHHFANAPRFASLQACEAAFQRCQADGNQFMPQIEGFVITTERQVYDDSDGASGSSSGGGSYATHYDYVDTPPRYSSEAMYHERDGRGGFQTSTVTQHADVLPARFTRVSPAWRVGQHSGFASNAPARGGFGS